MQDLKHIQALQRVYVGVLADALLQFEKEGVLGNVVARKKQEQMDLGKQKAALFEIKTPEDVFTGLSEFFGCANWKLIPRESGFTAEATSCILCAFSKKIGAPSPCNLYCLDPMEGMVKGINPKAKFDVTATMWKDSGCRVLVEK